MKAHLALTQKPLFLNVGEAVLPHPLKHRSGTDYPSDPDLSEDAFFHTKVELPDGKDQELREFHYLGVADGVGSWREYGTSTCKRPFC